MPHADIHMQLTKKHGHIALFGANLIFGLNTPISRTIIPEIIDPFSLTFLRLAGSTLLFWIISFFVKKEKVPFKDIVMLFFASIFGIVLNQIPYITGLSMTSPIDASLVTSLLPIITMLLAALIIKEPVTWLKAIGVLVGASGAFILIMNSANHHGKGSFTGDLIILSAATSYALYLTMFKKIISKYSSVTVMKWMFLFATILSYPVLHKSVIETSFSSLNGSVWLRIGFIVIFATFISYLLIPVGQKTIRPTTLSMYNYMQPVVASLVAVGLGMDTFGYEKIVSTVLVFAGVYIVTQSKSRAQIELEKSENKAK
ncbi:MAG: protein of unknown function transrane [Bacteroidetes bacterium]|nr:protein of unknown function transrane [Bacteroidota bacterium]